MSEPALETPWTRPAIRRAPIECFELLQQCEDYSIRLGKPRIVATSSGPRIVRAIVPTEIFWRNWERYFWTFKKMGVVVSKESGNWATRLWTRLPELRMPDLQHREGDESNRAETVGNVIRPLRWVRS
jgi:hypothetical protein